MEEYINELLKNRDTVPTCIDLNGKAIEYPYAVACAMIYQCGLWIDSAFLIIEQKREPYIKIKAAYEGTF